MNSFHPELFVGIDWGTGHVYRQTQEIASQMGLRVVTLPVLSDIDRPEDLNLLKNDPRFSSIIEQGRTP